MPAPKTSCAFAVSVTCDNNPDNEAAFKAAFESAVKALRALSGSEPHGNGNGQFYGEGGAVYMYENDVAADEPAEPARTGIKKSP